LNILKNLYSINSTSDLLVLKFGLFISLTFAFVFLALLLGSTIFSLVHFSKAKTNNDNTIFAFSKFVSGLVTKMWFRFLLGFLPMLGSVFFFTQLYAEKIPSAPSAMLIAFILFLLGLCSILIYKNLYKTENVNEITNTFLPTLAWLGIGLISVSSFILVAYLQASILGNKEGFFAILFSPSAILYFFLFVSLSFGLTSGVIIAVLNRTNEGIYKSYARYFSTYSGLIFSFLHPLLFVLIVLSTPVNSLSFLYFGISALVLLLMLLTAIQFYYSYKNSKAKTTSIVFLFVLLISFLVYSTNISSEVASKKEMLQKHRVELFS